MIVVRSASGVDEIGEIVMRGASGLSDIGSAFLRDGSGLQEIFAPGASFSVDVTPDVYGYGNSLGSIAITTSFATATPNGGRAPFTYSWAITDSLGASWVVVSPSAQSTSLRAASVPATETATATAECTVTDADGRVAVSPPVSAEVYNYGGYA